MIIERHPFFPSRDNSDGQTESRPPLIIRIPPQIDACKEGKEEEEEEETTMEFQPNKHELTLV